MKKLFMFLLLTCTIIFGIQKSFAMKFDEALTQTKPMAVLIYADWADDSEKVMQAYDAMEPKVSNKYNFTKINIATEDTKPFNKMYHIYPNLPYVLFFKDRGRISRYLKKDCVLNEACFKEKLDFFAN